MGEIRKQSISNSVLGYTGAFLGFLIIYIQPHLISSSDIGLIRLMFSFSWMVAVVMPFGMGSITLRFFPKIRNPENRHHGFFSLLFMLTSMGALIVASVLYLNRSFFVSYYSRSPEFPRYFEEVLLFSYILSLISVYNLYSSSLLKTTFTVFLTDVFTRIGQLILVVLYHYGLFSRHIFVLGYISIFFIQLLLLVIYLYRRNSVSFHINYSFFKTLDLKEMSVYALLMTATAFASLGIKFLDQLMIGHYLSSDLVGVYATCVMMCVVMDIPFNALERIANPRVAEAWNNNNRAEVEKIYEMSSRYLFFIGSVLFCLLWSALDLIFYFLPQEYHQGKMAFYIVSFASLINLVTGVNSTVILYSHKYFAGSVFLFVLIFVGYFSNKWLIPVYGITGAAFATLIAIGTFNILKYFYILLRFKMQPFSRFTLLILVTAISSCVFTMVLPGNWNLLLRTGLSLAYAVAAFLFLNVRFEIIGEVNKVLRKYGLLRAD